MVRSSSASNFDRFQAFNEFLAGHHPAIPDDLGYAVARFFRFAAPVNSYLAEENYNMAMSVISYLLNQWR
jgi:hypothetical protein